MTKKAIIYARVSSVKQKEGETVQSQVEALIDYASKHDYCIPEGWIFKDEGISGSILPRPALDAVRELVHENLVDVILVYSPDRLSRKYAHQLLLEMEFEKQKVELIFINSPKAKTPEEQLSLHFRSVFAEYERAQITERCRRGRNYRAQQGSISVIANAPIGYTYVKKSENSLPQYVVNERSNVVKKIFSYYIQSALSIRKICRQLELDGIPSPDGHKTWSTSTVREILNNEAYTGKAHFGKTELCEGISGRIFRTPKGEKRTVARTAKKDRPKEKWIPIKVPQIISEDDFEAAQAILKENRRLSARNTREPSILQGLVVCGQCGSPYYKKVREKKYSYYSCAKRLVQGGCQAPSIKLTELDEMVWNHIVSLLRDPKLIADELERRRVEASSSKRESSSAKELDRGLLKLATARNKLLDAYQEGDSLTLNELKKRIQALERRRQAILNEKKSLEEISLSEQRMQAIEMHLDHIATKIAKSSELTIDSKQRILRLLISEIVIKKEQIEIKHCIPSYDSASPAIGLLSSACSF